MNYAAHAHTGGDSPARTICAHVMRGVGPPGWRPGLESRPAFVIAARGNGSPELHRSLALAGQELSNHSLGQLLSIGLPAQTPAAPIRSRSPLGDSGLSPATAATS